MNKKILYLQKKLKTVIFSISILLLFIGHSTAQDLNRFYDINELIQELPVNSIAFSPDDKYLASGSDDKTIKIFLTKDWSVEKILRVDDKVKSVAFSSNGEYLAAAYKNSISGWYVGNWTELFPPTTLHSIDIFSITFLNNNSIVSSSGKSIGSNVVQGEIKIYNITNKKIERTINEHTDIIKTIAFSPNNKYLASGSLDKTIKIFSTDNWSVIKTLTEHTNKITSLSFSNDGKYFASSSLDNTTKIFSTDNWQMIKNIPENSSIYSLAFSKNNYLAIGMRGFVKVYDFNFIKEFIFKGNIFSIAFSSNGEYLAFGSSENKIKIVGYLPDLDVKINIGRVVSGEKAVIEVIIENKGMANAIDIPYIIYYDDKILKQGNISIEKNKIKKITAEIRIELFDITEHKIKIKVNPNNKIKEENYVNNIQEIKINAQPNIVVFGIFAIVFAIIIIVIFIIFKFIKIRIRKKTENSIEEAKILIDKMKEKGIILKNAEEKLAISIDFFNKKQYKKANESSIEAMNIAYKTKEVKEDLLKAIDKLSDKIAELNSKKLKTKEGEELFLQLKKLVVDGEYENAIDIAVKCGELLEKAKTLQEDSLKKIREFENFVLSIKEPINTFEIKWNISRARTSYDRKEFEGAIKLIEVAEGKLAELKEQYLNAKTQIQSCEEKIQELKGQGKNTLSVERILRETKFLFDRRDYGKVIENIKKLVDEIEKI